MRKNTERYNLSRSDLQYLIDQRIFNEMDRLILADRLLNGLTLENLAGKYEISVTSVKDRLYRAMDRLERHM